MPSSLEEISSPDPLQDSLTYSSPIKTPVKIRNTTRARNSINDQASSPRKQIFELDVGDKSSPHKIKVTVEADDSDKENGSRIRRDSSPIPPIRYHVPAIRHKEKTTTTTIPVKGLSDSEDDTPEGPEATPKRGRGRPQKSGTPVPGKSQSRKLTPKRRRTLGSLVDGDDEDDWNFALGSGVEIRRGKGRSRSRSVKSNSRKPATPAPNSGMPSDNLASSVGSRKGRRKTLTPGEILVFNDEAALEMNNEYQNEEQNNADRVSEEVGEHVERHQPDVSKTERSYTTSRSSTRRLSSTRYDSADSYRPNEVNDDVQNEDWLRSEVDANDEPPEFDTILESEGFSMISVDSVPSMRENRSSPLATTAECESPVPLTFNETPKSLNRSVKFDDRNSPLNPPSQQRGLVTPEREIEETGGTVGPASIAKDEDSFSSVPSEILRAATPAKKPLIHRVLSARHSEAVSRRDSASKPSPSLLESEFLKGTDPKLNLDSSKLYVAEAHDDSFSSVPPEVLEAATPKPKTKSRLLGLRARTSKNHEDSFSSVLSVISAAATPAKDDQNLHRSQAKFQKDVVSMSSLQEAITDNEQSEPSRLLTPEETPSPPQEAAKQSKSTPNVRPPKADFTHLVGESRLSEGPSMLASHMRSSPPPMGKHNVATTSQLRSNEILNSVFVQTPSAAFSSPSLPPLIQQQPMQKRFQTQVNPAEKKQFVPEMVPSMRAGSALHALAAPISSAGRHSILRSPFKSPNSRRGLSLGTSELKLTNSKSSRIQSGQHITATGIQSGDTLGSRNEEGYNSSSMKSGLAREQRSTDIRSSVADVSRIQEDDPFSGGSQRLRSRSEGDNSDYALDLPGHSQYPQSGTGTQEVSVLDEDMMSWQHEEIISLANGSATGSHEVENTSTSGKIRSVIAQKSDVSTNMSQLTYSQREEQWARERVAVSQKIESASTSKVIVLSSDDSMLSERNSMTPDDDDEDIWQAEARHSSSLINDENADIHVEKETSTNTVELTHDAVRPESNGLFERKVPIPQNLSSRPNFKARRMFSSKLVSSSSSQATQSSVPSLILHVQKKAGLFDGNSNAQNKRLQGGGSNFVLPRTRISDQDENERPSSPIDISFFAQIPQKLNFTPDAQHPPRLNLGALFTSSPVKAPHRKPTPVISTVDDPTTHGTDETNGREETRYDESSVIDASAAIRSQLQSSQEEDQEPLYSPQFSSPPDKSSMRLPSQQFDDSELQSFEQSQYDVSQISDIEPSQVDNNRSIEEESMEQSQIEQSSSQSSIFLPPAPGPLRPNPLASPTKSCFPTPSPVKRRKSVIFNSPAEQPSPVAPMSEQETTPKATIATQSSIPAAQSSAPKQSSAAPESKPKAKPAAPAQLSSTIWSDSHSRLLIAYYKDYIELGPKYFGDGTGKAGRESHYTGMTIYGRTSGHELKLKAWHMDVVAAFMEEVPGWDEGTVAKRLYAYVICKRMEMEGARWD